MNREILFWLGLSILGFSCNSPKSPDEIFALSHEKILQAKQVGFNQLMIWEDPNLGEFDSLRYESLFQLNSEAYLSYDFYGKRESVEIWYTGNVQYQVNHEDSTVMVLEDLPERIRSNSFRSFTPLNLLVQEPWVFKKDTVIQGKSLMDFVWVEMDTLIMDKKVFLENHLFINPANFLPDFLSRRLYHDGKRNQLIEVFYSDYSFGQVSEPLEPKIPQGYISKVEGDEVRESKLLTIGDKAPEFRLQDMDGNWVSLADFRGKKVLLDFSMIYCGWCKIAIDQFNKPDFEFKDDLVPLYINPVDPKEKMDKYQSKVSIPFPVLTDAKKAGEAYGVNGYPTFFLIDENGKIEDVVVGFNDEAILKWKK